MRQFLAVVIFSLATVAFFAGYSNFGIPQIEPAPPPEEEELDLGAMTMEGFIALGQRIHDGKGTCTLCHNELGRAPMLDEVAAIAEERLADTRYKGQAVDAEGYLVESLVEPSAFVVAGFGKKGTNDTQSPMPDVTAGSIGLSEVEIAAVVAYLQDLAGVEVTVEIPAEAAAEEEEEPSEGEPRALISDPAILITQFSCDACHIMASGAEGGDIGPNLSTIGAMRDRDYLRRALLDPNAEIAEGFEPDVMPPDLGEQLYATEVELLLDYLLALK